MGQIQIDIEQNHSTEISQNEVRKFSVLSLVDDIVPLFGLLFLGWSSVIILPLYWVENVAVGYYTYRKLMLPDIVESGITVRNGSNAKRPAGRKELAHFFAMHYGIFTLVHGVFAFTVLPQSVADSAQVSTDASPLLWAVPAALITALVAERMRFVREISTPSLRSALTQGRVMGSAYARIIVLHVSILIGAWIITALGLPQGAAILLILLKMTIEFFKGSVVFSKVRVA